MFKCLVRIFLSVCFLAYFHDFLFSISSLLYDKLLYSLTLNQSAKGFEIVHRNDKLRKFRTIVLFCFRCKARGVYV